MGVKDIKVTELSKDEENYYITYTIMLCNGVDVTNNIAIYDITNDFFKSFERLQGIRPEKILRLLNKFIENIEVK